MVKKVVLTYMQAGLLEHALKYHPSSSADAVLMSKHVQGWKGLYSTLNEISTWDFANILFSSRQYEVDPATSPDYFIEQSQKKWLELGREEVGLADGDIVIKDGVAYKVASSLRGRGREVTLQEAEKWRQAGMLLGFYPSESFTGLSEDGEPPCRKCKEDRCVCPPSGYSKLMTSPVEESVVFCNFCGKHHDHVEVLVASKGSLKSYICNECIVICFEIVEEKMKNDSKGEFL